MFPNFNFFRATRDGLADDVADLRDLINAHERVDLGEKFRQLIAKALREAPGDDQPLTAMLHVAHGGGFEDRIDALFLRGVDERTGVDDDHIGSRSVVGHFNAILEEGAEHDFGIDEILGAAQGNQADAPRLMVVFGFGHLSQG